MKIQHLLLLACAATVLGTYAAEQTSNPPVVALCFVTAADAFTAVQQKLGANAAEAVSRVDEKRNTVALNSTHSQAAIVRAFLTGLDHRPPEVRVNATSGAVHCARVSARIPPKIIIWSSPRLRMKFRCMDLLTAQPFTFSLAPTSVFTFLEHSTRNQWKKSLSTSLVGVCCTTTVMRWRPGRHRLGWRH